MSWKPLRPEGEFEMKPQGNSGWTDEVWTAWRAPEPELGGTDGAKSSCLQRKRFSSSPNEHPLRASRDGEAPLSFSWCSLQQDPSINHSEKAVLGQCCWS